MTWRVVNASAIGTDHVAHGMPNQDCAVVESSDERLVIAVADGAGSARFAEVGARLACENAVAVLRVAEHESDVGPLVIAGVRAAVEAEAEARGATVRDFACTLLAVVLADDWSLFVQCGDGVIVVGTPAGYAHVFWPEKGEHINETAFVTMSDAAKHLEVKWGERVDEVAVLTDGLERLALDFIGKAAFASFFAPMFGAVKSGAEQAELEAFLGSPRVNERTSDDKTLVLALR